MGDSHTPSFVSSPLADRQSPMPPASSTTDSTGFNSESHSSSITVDGSKRFLDSHHCLQLDAEQTHWTDEKHRSYLDSLEASFVQGLHQHRRMHALSSKQKMRRKPIMLDTSSSEVRQHIHKKSGRKQCSLETPDLLEECGSCSDRRHIRHMTNSCGSARNSQQTRPCCFNSYTIITEVSDQNFVDNQPGELSGGMPIAKRLKKASSGFLDNAQVVPFKRLS
ncbi:cold-regulated protein 28 isoform X2 [Cucumis melo]|uniref:Cold-regulated protein 28 isoform X2 n=1 Tax=Cucumis melo TaxID=3656 RepID=A0A1S3BZQ8_CUCME|nr:cold-regulated protein 28 isoform X2 [Cucumis melo]